MASPCTARYYGKRVTPRLEDALWCLNRILQNGNGEKSDMSMMQGSCSTSVGASAGTHAGGDAGDLTAYNQKNRVKYGRLIGFNIHYRAALRNVWSAHVHFTMLGSKTVSSAARAQNNVWEARYGNGLANGGKATGYLPDHKNIHFVRKDTNVYRANKKTTGFNEPAGSSNNKVVDRDTGWTFEALGVVEVDGVEWIFNATPTFYKKSDFDKWVKDWVKKEETYQVVKPTDGRSEMWDKIWPNTHREPGYIIKTVGHTTKAPIGVATENGVWYRQSDLKKIDNKYSNSNPPPGTTVPKEPEPEAPEKVDKNLYEVTANPSLYGLAKPGLGNEKKTLLKKGTVIAATASKVVNKETWIKNDQGYWFHSHYLKNVTPIEPEYKLEPFKKSFRVTHDGKWGMDAPHGKRLYERSAGFRLNIEQTTEIDGHRWYITDHGTWYDETHLEPWEDEVSDSKPDDMPITAHEAEWRVTADKKEATAGPGGKVVAVRNKGYHLYTIHKAIVDNVVYYISVWGYWYSADGLVPWSVPENPFPKPVEPTPSDPVVQPTPKPPTKATKPRFKAGTQNIMVRRLGPKPTGSAPFKYGASYVDRMKILADEVKKLGLSILATQEAGAYKDRDTLTDALSKATGNPWAGILHGDNGDITQSVHWDKSVWTLKKEGTIKSYGSTHNKHTYVRLEHKASGKHVWFVSVHLRYGPTMKNHRVRQIKDIVEGAWKLAGDEPVMFLGDFNNNKKDNNAVTKNMKANGYNAAGDKLVGLKDTLNDLNTTISKATQIYDNIYWYKSRKIHKASVHHPQSGGKYKKPFISDHNMLWGDFEV